MEKLFSSYNIDFTDTEVREKVNSIISDISDMNTIENLKKIFSFIDLTTLNTEDTRDKAKQFAVNVSNFKDHFPDIPNVAAICVYPSLVKTVREHLHASGVGIASVVGGFPSSQTFIDVKCVETSFAVKEGANEADMVISVGEFLSGNYELVYEEIKDIKDACGDAHLKVILETGALPNLTLIKKASILAMEAGGDFIKTSTGKLQPAATLEAVYVMAEAIKEFYEKTGKMVGIKPAGGISVSNTALQYYALINHVLGETWLSPNYFRIGASSLANKVLTDIQTMNNKDESINYF